MQPSPLSATAPVRPAGPPAGEPGATGATSRRVLRAAALAAALWALGQAGATAWLASWTVDEPAHLEWSARFLDTGETERASQPWYNSKTPVSVLNVLARRGARGLGVRSPEGLRFAARLPTVALLALLLAGVYLLGRRLAGRTAGELAVLGAALDPNLAAHGALVTTDLALALATLGAVAAGFRVLKRPGPAAGAWLGAALGLVLVVKLSGLLVAVLVAALVGGFELARHGRGGLRRLLSATVVAALVAGLVLWAGYGFQGAGAAGRGELESPLLAGIAKALPFLPALVPAGWLAGVDATLHDDATLPFRACILGRSYEGGVWFYFLVLWLVKTPLALLAATWVGLATALRRREGTDAASTRLIALLLLALGAYFSFFFHTQLGYRFALPCLPLVYLLAARGLAPRVERSRRASWWVAATAALALLPQLPYFGDPLSFTNAAVPDKSLAWRVVADSNLDWGQNTERVERWRARQPVNIRFDPYHPLPGAVLVSGNRLAGVATPDRWTWARENLRPVRHVLHTHFLIEITPEQFDAYLRAARRVGPGMGLRACDPTVEAAGLEPDGALALPDRGGACLAVREPLRLGFEATGGEVGAGFELDSGKCLLEPLSAGQEAWFEVAPGAYPLCSRGRGGQAAVRVRRR